MKKWIRCLAAALCLSVLPMSVRAQQMLVPVGSLIGLHLNSNTMTIVRFAENGQSLAKDAGLRIGDELLEIDGHPIHTAQDISSLLTEGKSPLSLTYRRGGKEDSVTLSPAPGQKLGLYLQQGITGVGTVTWYDPATGQFGSLGHGVSDSSGAPLAIRDGQAYYAQVSGLQKGRIGAPGQLRGDATMDTPFGILFKNTPQGVFGKTSLPFPGTAMPTASADQVHLGQAVIRATVTGKEPRDYTVEILKLYPTVSQGRNILLRVTDEALLAATGGIIQGMSGSPIIQDDHLIGAVTHVLVNNPCMGYGIFIENMLEAA